MSATREKLLDATIEVLRHVGLADLSARTIAGRAGVNQALIFYHFGTLDNLVREAVVRSVEASSAAYADRFAEVSTLGALLAVGRELHAREFELGNVAVMAQVMAGAQSDVALADAARLAMARWSGEIEVVVRRVLADSPVAGLVDPAGLAQAISAGFLGLELLFGVDPEAGGSALASLEALGRIIEAVDGLGPLGARALRSRVRRGGGPRRNDR